MYFICNMYPLPHFNNLLSSGHIYRVNFLRFITGLGRMNIRCKIKKFKIKFSRKIVKKNLGFYPYLVLDSFFVQSSSSLLEQYIGLCPNTIIQGRLLLASGVLACNKHGFSNNNINNSSPQGWINFKQKQLYNWKNFSEKMWNYNIFQ